METSTCGTTEDFLYCASCCVSQTYGKDTLPNHITQDTILASTCRDQQGQKKHRKLSGYSISHLRVEPETPT